ncbi:hypothetical protein TVNIR_3864 [Thioalkalivibrio nitratireducens DSM 14787]|uniref:Uncharacterized protein n=1 Tax=Thioalkalivibrio nitratireducens (strain DSM 14787 / UNIQEM 213 / ALEN2) TaxID=1255043 RepID=L0E2G7_THIND|nr:hypothetical protein TVNIR_3864 [Thioalkalivibrio nitratireducens DSM 14787]
MEGCPSGFGIQHENVDGLVTEAQLQPGDQLQSLAAAIRHWLGGLHQQIDVTAASAVVHAGPEHVHHRIGAEEFGHRGVDRFLV